MSTHFSENEDLTIGPLGGLLAGTLIGGTVSNIVAPQTGLAIVWAANWLPWIIGAILGLLYGACQVRVPLRGLVAVGVFYGIFLWVLSNLVGWLLFPLAIGQLRSWPGIGMFILFSGCLGLTSIIATLIRGDDAVGEAQH